MRLFHIVASRGDRIVFDSTVEADTPREARKAMKTALGVPTLTGIVHSITEIPVDLIRAIASAAVAEVLPRVGSFTGAEFVDMLRPIVEQEVRRRLTTRHAGHANPASTGGRFDPMTPA